MMSTENTEEDEAGKYQPGCLVKSELAEAVAESTEINRNEAAHIVDVIFDSMMRALNRGERVELRGFGIFGIRQRKSRTGRNPKTGVPVAVPAKRVVFFALSRTLGKTLNPV
jgi:integration host factor subunit beta